MESADHALDLRVVLVADYHNLIPARLQRLGGLLRAQHDGASGIDDLKPAVLGLGDLHLGQPVGADHHRTILMGFQLLDLLKTLALQLVGYALVVNQVAEDKDVVPLRQRLASKIDSALNAKTEPDLFCERYSAS